MLMKSILISFTKRFKSTCPSDVKLRKLSLSDQILILSWHNYYRMVVAQGYQPLHPESEEYFPSASRMMKLKWSDELTYLASLQLKTCGSHDPCHNVGFNATTGRLIMANQNIFYFWKQGKRYDFQVYLELAVFNWFNEYQVAPLNTIDSLYYYSYYTIGHFTQLIHDQNTHVGCAAAEWTEDNGDKKYTKVTCNYLKANYAGRPVYER